jgi:uncharacterized surface protein with fasciclin (FAS1) repeats
VAAAVFGISVTLQACGGSDSPSPSPAPSTTAAPGTTTVTPRAGTIPAIAEDNPDLSDLFAALNAAELVGTLSGDGPFTVFAPNNSAFDALPNNGAALTYLLNSKEILTKVLEYHVASGNFSSGNLTTGQKIPMLAGGDVTVDITGGTVKINSATVIKPDVEASNGVIHIIDQVLLPSDVNFTSPTIPELASSDTDLSTLVIAVGAANLGDKLAQLSPLTVFAPTNEAFTALNASCECLEALLKDQTALASVLEYHVLDQELTAAQLVSGGTESIKTLGGSDVNITISDGKVMINGDTTVTTPDLYAVNGVVHVIDQVLLPPGFVPPTSTEAKKVLV